MSTFHTIKSVSEGLYKEKGSKFISIAYPVQNESDIKQSITAIKKQYFDARHHCFAWVLGMDSPTWRANDDGEPAHSAGDPILSQIRAFNLTNTFVVVVRYFGGTKLGVGGLIRAYKTAAEDALRKAEKVAIHEMITVSMSFNYDMLSTCEQLIAHFEIAVLSRDFQTTCRITGNMKKEHLNAFRARTSDLYNIAFEII